MFLLWVVFEIFTPIMGRSGTEIPPEVVLASLVTLATIFLSSFFVSIPNVRDHKIWIVLVIVVDGDRVNNNISHFVSVLVTFHLLGTEHQVDPGWSGLCLPHHVPVDFVGPPLSLFRQPGEAAAKTSLSAGSKSQSSHTEAQICTEKSTCLF